MDHVTHFSLDVCVVKYLLAAASGVAITVAGIVSPSPTLGTCRISEAATRPTASIAIRAALCYLLVIPLLIMNPVEDAFVELFLPHRADLLLLNATSVLEICKRCLDGLWAVLAMLKVRPRQRQRERMRKVRYNLIKIFHN